MYDLNPSYKNTKRFIDTPTFWAGWHYEQDEWAEFDKQEWQRARRDAFNLLRTYCLLAIPLGLIFGIASYGTSSMWVGLYMSGAVILWGVWSYWVQIQNARRLHQSRQRGPRIIWISPVSVYQAGVYIPLVERRISLQRAFVKASEPRILRFSLLVGSGRTGRQFEVRLPIPRGSESEAAQLVERFQREVVRGQ